MSSSQDTLQNNVSEVCDVEEKNTSSNDVNTSNNDENTSNNDENNNFDLQDELNDLNEKNDLSDLLKNIGSDEGISKLLGSEENLGELLKQFTSGFSNTESGQENHQDEFNLSEENDDIDFDSINLDKYLISSKGDNLCDILSDIKDELIKINNK